MPLNLPPPIPHFQLSSGHGDGDGIFSADFWYHRVIDGPWPWITEVLWFYLCGAKLSAQGLAFRIFSGCDGLPDGVGWKYLKMNMVVKATWGKGWQTDKQQTDQKAWGGTGCRSRHIREKDLEKLPTNPGNLEDQMWAQGWIHAQKRHQAFTSGWHLSSVQAVSEGWNWALKLSDQVWKECPNTQLICKAGISISLLASDIPGNFCQTTQWPQS